MNDIDININNGFLPLLPRQIAIRDSLFDARPRPRHLHPDLRRLCAKWLHRRRQLHATGMRYHDITPSDACAFFMMADECGDCAIDLKAYLEMTK